MIIFTITIILHIFSIYFCHEETQENPDITKKIVGGHNCSVEEYPFIVSLRTSRQLFFICGGSLIAEDWVLTAAHCLIYKDPRSYAIVAGVSETYANGIQRKPLKALIKHPEYNKPNKTYDIALIHLKEPFNLSTKYVGTIALPSSEIDGDLKDNCSEATVMGWGLREGWGLGKPKKKFEFNPILQCVSIPLLTDQECRDIMRKPIKVTENTVCAYHHNESRDSCQGDSGGPLACNNTLFGVVSHGYGCAVKNTPGLYTRVDKYLDFITNTMSAHEKIPKTRSGSSNKLIFEYGIIFLICTFHFIYFFVG